MRIVRAAMAAAVIVVATAGLALAQLPGEPRPPASFDACADMQYTFARGAPNEIVRQAQRVLGELGYYAGPLDGILGPDVRRAVWNFQKVQNITRSGSLDAPTVIALGLAPVEIAAPPESFSYALPAERAARLDDVQAP